jgi:uncharacterized protein (TIGR00299 family) protein
MILAAFLDAGLDFIYLKRQLRKLPISGYDIERKKVKRQGLAATVFEVHMDGAGHRRKSLKEIRSILYRSRLNRDVKGASYKIFETLATAEAKAHGRKKGKVYFHEIGDIDSIIDIVGTVIALDYLKFDRIYSSPINVGYGTIETAHGIFPIPAPATSVLLKGVPAFSEGKGYELATPTGVAILKTISDAFCQMPLMKIDSTGCGAGTFDTPGRPNMLRIFSGGYSQTGILNRDKVLVVETNIDDMNLIGTEAIMERIFKAGALDVYFEPIYMKKSRMGVKLSVITDNIFLEPVLNVIFQETSTFGVRTYEAARYKLGRAMKKIKTSYGSVGIKIGRLNNKIISISPEYEDCKKIAKKNNISFRDVYEQVKCSVGKELQKNT